MFHVVIVEDHVIPSESRFLCQAVGDGYDNLTAYQATDVEKQHDAQYDAYPMQGIYFICLNSESAE